jgi:protein HIRA/HIR1
LNGFGAPSANTGHEIVNTLIAKRNTKRRTQQQSLGPRGDSSSDIVTDVLIDSLGSTSSVGAKRKSSILDMPEDRSTKARTLGGDRFRDGSLNIIKEIWSPVNQRTIVTGTSENERGKGVLSAPPVLTYLSLKVTDAGDDMLECKNAENGGELF